MSRDPRGSEPLDEAVRALREEGDAAAPQAKLTRERILRDLRPRARSRRWVWAVPVAALLAGSTVLAATGRLPVVLQTVGETAARVFGRSKHQPGTPRESTPRVATPAASALAPPVAEPAPAVVEAAEPPPQVEPSPAPHADSSARRHARGADAGTRAALPPSTPPAASAAPPAASATPPAASAAPEVATPEADETLALYRRAHRLHFVEQNPSAALAAWNDYLAKNPRGPLVVDALYDRALCLVRLGRRAEARTALEPFADGRYGSYRQKDAQALIQALQSP
jgi:hypothetical protein